MDEVGETGEVGEVVVASSNSRTSDLTLQERSILCELVGWRGTPTPRSDKDSVLVSSPAMALGSCW
jgi:hypothetical protein